MLRVILRFYCSDLTCDNANQRSVLNIHMKFALRRYMVIYFADVRGFLIENHGTLYVCMMLLYYFRVSIGFWVDSLFLFLYAQMLHAASYLSALECQLFGASELLIHRPQITLAGCCTDSLVVLAYNNISGMCFVSVWTISGK